MLYFLRYCGRIIKVALLILLVFTLIWTFSLSNLTKNLLKREILPFCTFENSKCCPSNQSYIQNIKMIKQKSRLVYKERLARLELGCKNWGSYMRSVNESKNLWKIVYIDSSHSLLYCFIPKTGSTTWSYHMAKLAGFSDIYSTRRPRAFAKIAEAKQRFVCPIRNQSKINADHVLATVFVRHPFHRLVSSYKNRIQTNFWVALKPTIEAILARRKVDSSFPKGKFSDITFAELVDFVLSIPSYQLNRHLAPQWTICPICQIQWDVLGEMGTFDEDANHVIKQLHLENLLQVNSTLNKSGGGAEQSLYEAFSQLNTSTILGLHELYRIDFDLFGYNDLDKYLNWASDTKIKVFNQTE